MIVNKLRSDAKNAIPPGGARQEDIKAPSVMLSARNEFPTEWAAAKTSSTTPLAIPIQTSLLPYWAQKAKLSIKKVSTLDLPASDATFGERWPNAGGKAPLGLGTDGTGKANLGTVASGVEDILLLIQLGEVTA